jgi:hypothetical protein
MKNQNRYRRASEKLVLSARYQALSIFQDMPWRQRAKAVRMLIAYLKRVPATMERAADLKKPYCTD